MWKCRNWKFFHGEEIFILVWICWFNQNLMYMIIMLMSHYSTLRFFKFIFYKKLLKWVTLLGDLSPLNILNNMPKIVPFLQLVDQGPSCVSKDGEVSFWNRMAETLSHVLAELLSPPTIATVSSIIVSSSLSTF